MKTKQRKLYLALKASLAFSAAVGLLVPVSANAVTVPATKSGVWSDTNIWTGGALPTPADTAQVNVLGGATVTYDMGAATNVTGLSIGGRASNRVLVQSGTGLLTVTGTLGLGTGGTGATADALDIQGGSVTVNTTVSNLAGAAGAGEILIGAGATGGLLTVKNTATFNNNFNAANSAKVIVSSGTLDSQGIFNNNGSVSLSGPGQLTNSGTFTNASALPGSFLATVGGNGTFVNTGTVNAKGGSFGDGTTNFTQNAGSLSVTGGTNSLATTNLNAGTATVSAGSLAFNGATGVASGVSVTVTGGTVTNNSGKTLTNAGTVQVSSTGVIDNQGTWTNNKNTYVSGTGSLKNSGTISTGAGNALSDNGLGGGSITNTGTINATGGTLGGTSMSFTQNTGGSLSVSGATTGNLGTTNLNAGTATISGGTLALNGATNVASGAGMSVTGGAVTNKTGQTLTNAGTVQVSSGSLSNTNANINNTGTLTESGGSLTGGTMTNSGAFSVNGGTFGATTFSQTGGTLTVNNSANNNIGTFAISGGTTALTSPSKIVVGTDYTNTGFSSGNTFNRSASVTGNTGVGNAATITSADIASGVGYNQGLSVNGGAVVHANNTTPSNGDTSLTVKNNVTVASSSVHTTASIAANGGAGAGTDVASGSYAINNGGSSTTIRGAVQDAGNITDARLTGSGVNGAAAEAATNYAANGIGPGSTSTALGVTFTGSSIGALSGQNVKVVDNFGETQTLSINSGGAYDLAKGSSADVTVANQRVGDNKTALLSVSNTSTSGNDSFTENLHTVVTTGGNTTGGGTVDVVSGTSGSVNVGVKNTSAGHITGTAGVALRSDAINSSGLGNTTLTGLTQNVSGNVYNAAVASTLVDHNFGAVHKNEVVTPFSQSLNNTAAPTTGDINSPNGYTEQLQAVLKSQTPDAINGSVSSSLINAGGVTNGIGDGSGTVSVGIDTSSVGNKSGNIVVGLSSDGSNTSGLASLSLAQQTVNVSATVTDYANAAYQKDSGDGAFSGIGPNWTLDFGSFTQGSGAKSALVDVKNTPPDANFTDLLGGTFSITGSGFNLTGFNIGNAFANSITGGGLFSTFFNNLSVGLSDAVVGSFSETIKFHWNGSNSNNGGSFLGTSDGPGSFKDIFLTLTGTVTSNGGQVPEPDTLWLFGVASVAAWLNTRRKKLGKAS